MRVTVVLATIWLVSTAWACLAEANSNPTPDLHVAVLQGDIVGVLRHIELGSDLDQHDAYGSAPLTIAATFDRPEVAKALIAAGADLQVTDAQGSTPLQIAAFLGRVDIAEALVAAGADRFARNGDGSSARDIASTPVDDDRLILEQLAEGLAPLGFAADYDRLGEARARIAALLEPTPKELAAVSYAPRERAEWAVSSPEASGVDPDLIADLYLEAAHLKKLWGLLVVKDEKLVAEGYFDKGGIDQVETRQSVAKSFMSALYGIGREKGCAPPLDRRMVEFFPEVAGQIDDSRKTEITIGDMPSCSSRTTSTGSLISSISP